MLSSELGSSCHGSAYIYMFACVKVSFRKKNLKGYADTYIYLWLRIRCSPD